MKYTIQKGDTLRDISSKFLGSSSKWPVLWSINKDVLRSKNPDLIYPGEVIEIPEIKSEPTPVLSVNDNNDVFLFVNGQKFSGWMDVSISRSIEAISGSFSVNIAEKWQGQKEKWPLFAGDKVELKIGNDFVVSGYIDEVEISINSSEHSITVKGRDKTSDLVDCSLKSGEWKNVKAEKVIKDICDLHGVSVISEIDTGSIMPSVKVQPGETVFETFDKIGKEKGILLTSTRKGELLLTSTGKNKVNLSLKEGENILSASVNYSNKERFSKYVVLGQDESSASGIATDSGITRNRQMVIIAESKADSQYCKKRASWESVIRAARSTSVSVEVQGWRDSNGKLWSENTLVNIDIPSFKINEEMLITAVDYKKGSSGTTTGLTLKRKDAFTPEITLKKGNEP